MSEAIFKPEPLSYYKDLTAGGECKIHLNQDQAAVVLKVYDYGLSGVSEDEADILHSLIGKLKDGIWP